MMKTKITTMAFFALFLMIPKAALASQGSLHLDGAQLSAIWALPFAGLLLSIALLPLLAPSLWHHHFGKISLAWAAAFLLPCFLVFQGPLTLYTFLHTIVSEYIPFILLLFALFTVAGGIRLSGDLVGSPKLNLTFLAIGTALASIMGTTGAAMLLIRPLVRANIHRRFRVHTVVFFIFLVANIGGSLSPLGDPPLFLGFLKGVNFFWTTEHMFLKTLFSSIILLLIYYIIDTILFHKEGRPQPNIHGPKENFGIEGKINFLFLLGVIGLVLMSGSWQTTEGLNIWQDITITWPNLARDVFLIVIALLSLRFTATETRRGNDFTWEPILEVAKLFSAIFITMAPAIAMLQAGDKGALKDIIALVNGADGNPINHMYFWVTGALSSFLDNAPTYLVFFNMASGEAAQLGPALSSYLSQMTTLLPEFFQSPQGLELLKAPGFFDQAQYMMKAAPNTLIAISAGAVFMGANTYIGNAPNFMVRSIAEEQGVKMPSFFGYMVWSCGILVPLFVLVTLIFFE